MDVTAWALYLLTAGLVIGAALVHYRLREPMGRGRWLLGLLRGLALAVLVLLLFDPVVPAGQSDAPVLLALVDGSLSMRMPDTSGVSAWDRVGASLAELRPDRLARFGDGPARPVASLGTEVPTAPGSRLGSALRAAMESGVGQVVVLTDGAVEDPTAVRRVLETTGRVTVRGIDGDRSFNAGIVDLTVPTGVRTAEDSRMSATVARVGVGGPDTVELRLLRAGRELARKRIPTPAVGRTARVELPFSLAPGDTGLVRLDLVLEAGGSIPDDDRRSAYLRVSEDAVGVAVVSFVPGQEPRFLMPVAARATGLPVLGWAAVTADRWVRLGSGRDAGLLEAAEAPRRALERADVIVLHGLDEGAPQWAREALTSADRVLVFPRAEVVAALPLDPGPARVADWYVTNAVPPSPLAPLLAGVEVDDVPPLTALRTPAAEGYWAPLHARAGRRGEPQPILLARAPGTRRVAVALGEGYWRWALAGGHGRALYDRLWAAVIGWLSEAVPPPAGVEPVDRVVARGEASRWRVPGDADSVRIRLRPVVVGQGAADAARSVGDTAAASVTDRTVAVDDDIAVLPPVSPGHYRYTVDGDGTGEGELTVSSYSAEFTRPVALSSAEGRGQEVREGRGVRRPLRGMPWAYVAVIVLLSAEWVLRRRWGLR